MRRIIVESRDNHKRIDRFLADQFCGVPISTIYKAFRKRNIRVNGKRVKNDFSLREGDIVEVFIPDEYLDKASKEGNSFSIEVLYEDDYILVVSKPQGIPVHQDNNHEGVVLDEYIRTLPLKGSGGVALAPGFPALCHRIDRNTGGLVILAKDSKTLKVMQDKFRNHEIQKYYLACTYGIPKEKESECTAYLSKDPETSRVMIYDNPVRGSVKIVTRYRIMKAIYPYALLEVELVTGRTHQIRAHLAWMGYPILGDGKYGKSSVNRALKLKNQALFSYKLRFSFKKGSSHLEGLNGLEISLPSIPWEERIRDTGLIEQDYV